MINRLKWLGLGLLCAMCAGRASADEAIRFAPVAPAFDYRWAVLKLALDHTTDKWGGYQLIPAGDRSTSQSRVEAELINGKVDVISYAATPRREKNLKPVRFDILFGMLGYRVMVIKSGMQPHFDKQTAQTLKSTITLGMNPQWGDYDIVKANGFGIVDAMGYDNIYSMLDTGRFMAFPRGINEVYPELRQYNPRYPDLAVEKQFAFHFYFPVYFWVNPLNTRLHNRIAQGLDMAMKDGSLKKLFLAMNQEAVNNFDLKNRIIIRLQNPAVPGITVQENEWWLKAGHK